MHVGDGAGVTFLYSHIGDHRVDKILQFLPNWLVPASAIGVLYWHADALISDAARRAISSKLRSADLSVLIVVFRSTIKTLINLFMAKSIFLLNAHGECFLFRNYLQLLFSYMLDATCLTKHILAVLIQSLIIHCTHCIRLLILCL